MHWLKSNLHEYATNLWMNFYYMGVRWIIQDFVFLEKQLVFLSSHLIYDFIEEVWLFWIKIFPGTGVKPFVIF